LLLVVAASRELQQVPVVLRISRYSVMAKVYLAVGTALGHERLIDVANLC
jgi:hypothetical protein